VIKGDEKRGLKPMAPDLKTVKDLDKYKDLFKDPEEPGKGRIYGAIAGWQVDEILYKKYQVYGLDKNFTYMRPGSEGALSASIASAYEKGEPWVGYYWEPTWVTGKYDLTLLEDEEYSQDKWKTGESEFPSTKVTVCINKDLSSKAPEVVKFLENYKTSSDITSEALAYMIENDASHEDTAKWFLRDKKDIWEKWVPENIAEKVNKAIQ
jgi:glycine betaine/proline transport system substrate-binding protein